MPPKAKTTMKVTGKKDAVKKDAKPKAKGKAKAKKSAATDVPELPAPHSVVPALADALGGEAGEAGGEAAASAAAPSSSHAPAAVEPVKPVSLLEDDDDDDEEAGGVSTCTTCKQPVGEDFVTLREGKQVRCGPCNRLGSRIHGVLRRKPELKDKWVNMSVENKYDFFVKNHKAMGDQLPALIEQSVQHVASRAKTAGFTMKGEYMDVVDLKKLYEGKPEQLASVMANAKQITCPVRGVVLYENPVYNSKFEDEQRVEESRSVQIHGKSKLRGSSSSTHVPKKQRAITTDCFSQSVLSKLAKLETAVDEKLKWSLGILELAEKDVRCPAVLREQNTVKRAQLQEKQAELTMMIESKSGDHKKMFADVKTALWSHDQGITTLNKLLTELAAFDDIDDEVV